MPAEFLLSAKASDILSINLLLNGKASDILGKTSDILGKVGDILGKVGDVLPTNGSQLCSRFLLLGNPIKGGINPIEPSFILVMSSDRKLMGSDNLGQFLGFHEVNLLSAEQYSGCLLQRSKAPQNTVISKMGRIDMTCSAYPTQMILC